MSSLILPEIKLVRAIMPFLVTSNFDDESIKTECASMETAFSHYGKFFRCSRAANSVVSGSIWPKFKLVRDFMHVLVTASIKRIGSKTTKKRWQHHFPHCKSMGAFCCHGNQSFVLICPKTLCSFPPTQ